MKQPERQDRRPPRSAEAFLQWFCDDAFLEEVQGDLHELYLRRCELYGARLSAFLYWLDAVRFFRPYLLKRRLFVPQFGEVSMFHNYLKIAFRNVMRHKAYSFINIFGLVIGLTACILILLFVQDELSYDRFHARAERIFRVTHEEEKDGVWRHFAYNYAPLTPALLTEFPQIEKAVRVFRNSVLVELDSDTRFQEDSFVFADSTFFDIFSFEFKYGNPERALQSPYDLVLTCEAAEKYFGQENPVGRVLTVENKYDFRVTGVLQKLPPNTHLQFDFVAAMGSIRDIMGWVLEPGKGWYYPPMYTYVLLPPDYPVRDLQAALPEFVARTMGGNTSYKRRLHLQPITDIHLRSNLDGEMAATGSMTQVTILTTIAFFILLIACINFMNLATARAANRALEVGMRKVVGARRKDLMVQFYGESMCYALAALALAVLLVELLLPEFNLLVGKELSILYADDWLVLLSLCGFSVLVGLISGSYPALLLSGFRPVKVLQQASGCALSVEGKGHTRLRAVLVVAQFAISIALIISASVIKQQVDYVQSKSPGFQKEQLIVAPVRDDAIQSNWLALKHELLSHPDVLSIAATSTIPGIERDIDFPIKTRGADVDDGWNIQTMMVDHDFISTLGMEIVAGRDFSASHTTDVNQAFILNEAAVRKLGWQDAVGKEIEMLHVQAGAPKRGKVIGVVQDFHFRSLHHQIEPLALQIAPASYYLDNLVIKVETQRLSETLTYLEQKWHELAPHRPFEYTFLDSVFEQLYLKEKKLSKIFTYASVLAILIGCLGLFGLASYTAERRTREIGIRKVLGATVLDILALLSGEFLLLVSIAFLIASPLTYYGMSQWLQNFDYSIELSLAHFLVCGLLALLIALFTVGLQAMKAAVANPVNSLRYQ